MDVRCNAAQCSQIGTCVLTDASLHAGSTRIVLLEEIGFVASSCVLRGRCPVDTPGAMDHFVTFLEQAVYQRTLYCLAGFDVLPHHDRAFSFHYFQQYVAVS